MNDLTALISIETRKDNDGLLSAIANMENKGLVFTLFKGIILSSIIIVEGIALFVFSLFIMLFFELTFTSTYISVNVCCGGGAICGRCCC